MAGLYEVLGLPAHATAEAIRAAITAQRRTWRRRTTSPDIAVRQEAERQMQRLDEAERTLLDPQRRASYNEREAVRPPPPEPGDVGDTDDDKHIIKALEQIDREQYGAAVFTARRAVDEDPENSYAWSVLAEAAARAGDDYAANQAIEKALQLDPEDARLHLQRGAILSDSGNETSALAAYRTAVQLDGARPEYRARLVEHLIDAGKLDEAIAEGEKAYQTNPDDGPTRSALAMALAERAVLAQHELPDGKLVITTREQAEYIESLCNRGLSIEAPDAAVNADLTQQRDYARRALKRRFSFKAFRRNYRWPVGLGMFAIAGACCLPSAVREGDPANLVIFTLLVLGLGALAVFSLRQAAFDPQYKRNAAVVENVVPRRAAMGPTPVDVEPSSRRSGGAAKRLR